MRLEAHVHAEPWTWRPARKDSFLADQSLTGITFEEVKEE